MTVKKRHISSPLFYPPPQTNIPVCGKVDGPPMYPSRFIHMFPKQRDLLGFDEVGEPVQVFSVNV